MNVLHVHSGNLFGGVETLLLTLSQHEHVSPTVKHHYALCFEGRFSEEVAAAGATIHALGNVRVSRPLSVLRARRCLRELLAQNNFDLVVCHSAWSLCIFGSVIRSAGLPLVFWLHEVPDGMPWPERRARSIRPDFVICNSKHTAERLPRLYSDVPSELIYCPVKPPSTIYSDAELSAVRDEFDTPRDAVVILQISRMESHKGHLTHLEALGLLADLPGWVCWQVGSAQRESEISYFNTVKETAARLGIQERVRFLGWQPDVQKLIAASDIYCQPNLRSEPFGITFVEALYAQKPVIATSLGGPKEIIDESCGFLVPPNDPRAVADALRLLVESAELRLGLGEAAPARAKALSDVSSQMCRIESCFTQVRNEYHKKTGASLRSAQSA